MNQPTTSGASWRPGIPAAWRDWFAFVRAPTLDLPRQRFSLAALGAVLWLLLLDVLVALPLAQLLGWLSKREALPTPQFGQITSKGPLESFLLIALIAPVGEEILFRSWLDGRRRHLVFILMLLLIVGVLWWFRQVPLANRLWTAGVLLSLLVLTGVLFWRAGKDVPGWFVRFFPVAYFGSTALFAAAHFGNYPTDRPWLLVPFVMPQLLAGLIFGFVRVRYGFWANVLLHASGNALYLSMMLLNG